LLANIATSDLTRDLLGNVIAMMNTSKPYVRRNETPVLSKASLRQQHPRALRLTQKPDVSVVSCAANVDNVAPYDSATQSIRELVRQTLSADGSPSASSSPPVRPRSMESCQDSECWNALSVVVLCRAPKR
jgi:hypothetical protein